MVRGHPEMTSAVPSSSSELGSYLDDPFTEARLDCKLVLTPLHLWPKPHRVPELPGAPSPAL